MTNEQRIGSSFDKYLESLGLKEEIEQVSQERIEQYNRQLNEDCEIPKFSQQIKDYMENANNAYLKCTTEKSRECFERSGLVYHPEIIKMFYKIGKELKND